MQRQVSYLCLGNSGRTKRDTHGDDFRVWPVRSVDREPASHRRGSLLRPSLGGSLGKGFEKHRRLFPWTHTMVLVSHSFIVLGTADKT